MPPSVLHQMVLEAVRHAIHLQITALHKKYNIAKQIHQRGSAHIILPDSSYGQHSPDTSFGFDGHAYPPLIIEVGLSQSEKDLRRVAKSYILGSFARIRTVITLNIDQATGAAAIQVWRARVTENNMLVIEQQTENAKVGHIIDIFVL